MKRTRVWMVVFGALFLTVVGCSGDDGMDGTSCTVTDGENNDEVLIECEDGTTATVNNGADGQDGADGSSCTVVDNGDGTKTISCEDGTTATVNSLVTETFDFPVTGDSANLNSGQYMFQDGHYQERTRTLSHIGVGLGLELEVVLGHIYSSQNPCQEDLPVDVLVNGTVYESLSIPHSQYSIHVEFAGPIYPNANDELVV